jgi:hypothetical protein
MVVAEQHLLVVAQQDLSCGNVDLPKEWRIRFRVNTGKVLVSSWWQHLSTSGSHSGSIRHPHAATTKDSCRRALGRVSSWKAFFRRHLWHCWTVVVPVVERWPLPIGQMMAARNQAVQFGTEQAAAVEAKGFWALRPTMSKAYVAAPKSLHKEFLGVPGAIGISLAVPFFSYFFDLGCNERGCPPLPFLTFMSNGWHKYTSSLQPWLDLYDGQAMRVYLAWYAFCVVCWLVLPGRQVEGLPTRDGSRLSYKQNGRFRSRLPRWSQSAR